jgi:hypothetical protein
LCGFDLLDRFYGATSLLFPIPAAPLHPRELLLNSISELLKREEEALCSMNFIFKKNQRNRENRKKDLKGRWASTEISIRCWGQSAGVPRQERGGYLSRWAAESRGQGCSALAVPLLGEWKFHASEQRRVRDF